MTDASDWNVIAKGGVEKVGLKGSFLKHQKENGDKITFEGEIIDHKTGIDYILGVMLSEKHGCIKDLGEIDAVGHRVVHGGETFSSSVFINDDEPGLHHDFEVWLEKLAPEKPYSQYRHNGFEDNADAHLKRTIMGREVVIAVTDGRLDFGPWEQVFYGEFDGKRRKRVLVKIIGE